MFSPEFARYSENLTPYKLAQIQAAVIMSAEAVASANLALVGVRQPMWNTFWEATDLELVALDHAEQLKLEC